MKVTLPEKVTGARDALFVLEVEFPVASVERVVGVEVSGLIEPLDLSGSSRGGTYRIPVGLERLHVPMRVLENAQGEATVKVTCTEGPEAGQTEERTLVLEGGEASGGGMRWSRWLAAAAAIAVVGVVAWFVYQWGVGDDRVPDLVGLTHEMAEAQLKEEGLTVKPRYEAAKRSEDVGVVIRTVPPAGADLPDHGVIEIVLGGPPDQRVAIPNYVGDRAEDAEIALRAAGFQVVTNYEDVDDPSRVNVVVAQSPEGGRPLSRGRQVEIWVGRAPASGVGTPGEPILPPPLPPIEPTPGPVEPPLPLPVEPPPGPVEPPLPPIEPPPPPVEPSTPALVPDADGLVAIPDMTGWTREQAEQTLRDAKLVPIVTLEAPPSGDRVGKVLRQQPGAGEKRGNAAMIFLWVGQGPPLEPTPGPVEPPPPLPVEPTPGPVEPPLPVPVEPTPGPVEPLPGPVTPPVQPPIQPAIQPAIQPGRVPDVVGEKREKAEGIVRAAGFLYHIVLKVTEYPPDGTVVGQDPAPGVSLPPGGEVILEIAQAPPDAKIPVPDVVGQERAVAERMLRDVGFLVNVTLGGGSPNEQGLVVDQAPVGRALSPHRTWVEIVVASGSGTRRTARGGPPAIGPTGPTRMPAPGTSSGLSGPPAVGPGPVTMPPAMPRGPQPLPPVALPPRNAPRTAMVPSTAGMNARDAIGAVLTAGLIPIIEVDRNAAQAAGSVLRQTPDGGSGALPGDLVRLVVAAGTGGGRYVDLPTSIGATLERAWRMFARSGVTVDTVEVRVPGHPYAGTSRVAAQYPVSRMPRAQAARVTLWVVLP